MKLRIAIGRGIATLLLCGLTVFTAVNVFAEDGETTVPWDQVPEVVRTTLLAQLNNAVPEEVEMDEEDGYTVYEAETEVDGDEFTVEVGAGGELLATEIEIDAEDLTAAIQTYLQQHFPDAQIREAEQVTVTYFEIEIRDGDDTRELHFLGNGRLMHDNEDDDEEDDD